MLHIYQDQIVFFKHSMQLAPVKILPFLQLTAKLKRSLIGIFTEKQDQMASVWSVG